MSEEIKELNEEIEVKEVEVKSKKIELDFTGDLDFKFDDVELDNYGQMQFDTFDYAIFKGMTAEIEKIEADYRLIESNGMYSKDFVLDKRVEALSNIMDVKSKYYQKAKDKIAELRKPVMESQVMTSDDSMQNLLKRLNNNVVASELMRTATVEDLVSLYEHNKENIEVRTMIKSRAFHLYRISKSEQLKRKAYQLYVEIRQFERELKNEDYFNGLNKIENTLAYLFEGSTNTNYYPAGLENGFNGFKTKKMFG